MTAHDRAKRRAQRRNPRLVAEIKRGHRELALERAPDPIGAHVNAWASVLGAAATVRQRDALAEWDAIEAQEAAQGARVVRSGPQGDQHAFVAVKAPPGEPDAAGYARTLDQLGMGQDDQGRWFTRGRLGHES